MLAKGKVDVESQLKTYFQKLYSFLGTSTHCLSCQLVRNFLLKIVFTLAKYYSKLGQPQFDFHAQHI